MNPQKRTEDLVVETVLDEIVVADMARDKAHHLNPMAAFVWQQCDGEKTPQQIASLVQMKFQTDQAEELVWMSLERLEKAHLLAGRLIGTSGRRTLTRREMLKLAGLTVALLPVVKSIIAPTAARAASGDRRVSKTGNCNNGNCISACSVYCQGLGLGCTGGNADCSGSSNPCFCCCTGCNTTGVPCIA